MSPATPPGGMSSIAPTGQAPAQSASPAPVPPSVAARECSACGAERAPGTRFCPRCGWRLSVLCPTCRALIPDDALFCPGCGRRAIRPRVVSATPALPAPAQPALGPGPNGLAAATAPPAGSDSVQRPVLPATMSPPATTGALAHLPAEEPTAITRPPSPLSKLRDVLERQATSLARIGQVLFLGALLLGFMGAQSIASRGDQASGGTFLKLAALAAALSALCWWRPTAPLPCAPVKWWRGRGPLLGGSVVLLGASVMLLPDQAVLLGSLAWIGAMVCLVAAYAERPTPRFSLRAHRWELLLIGLLTIGGAAARFWGLEHFPSGVHGDETEFGLEALKVIEGRGANPFAVVFLGDPALFVYLESVAIRLFGITITALRVLSALSGAVTLPLFYMAGRMLFGPRVALIALALLASMAAHLHYSRTGFNVVQVSLFAVAAIVCAARGVRTGGAVWYVLTGMALGLGTYFHFSARLLPIVLGALWLYAALRSPTWRREAWKAVGLAGAGFIVVVLPAVTYFAKYPHDFLRHHENQGVLRELRPGAGLLDAAALLLGQAQTNLEVFVNRPDGGMLYTFTGEPALAPLLSPLLIMALAMAVVRPKSWPVAVAGLWFFAALLGGILSDRAPHLHRLTAAFPAIVLLVAFALDRARATLVAIAGSGLARTATVLLVAYVGLAVFYDLHSYFQVYPRAFPWGDVTQQARFVETLDRSAIVRTAAAPWVFARHSNTRYLGYGMDLDDLYNPTIQLPRLELRERSLGIPVNNGLKEWVPIVKWYLGEPEEEVLLPGRFGRVDVIGLRYPAGTTVRQVTGEEGLRAVIRREDGPGSIERIDPAVVYRHAYALTDGKPFRGTWSGSLLVEQAGRYELEVYSDGPTKLTLDDRAVAEGGTPGDAKSLKTALSLSAGSHPIQLEYRYVRERGFLELYWKPPDGQRALVPPSALRPG